MGKHFVSKQKSRNGKEKETEIKDEKKLKDMELI